MSRNPFRYCITHLPRHAAARLHHRRESPSLGFGNQGIALDLESPDIYQYNLTLERELPGDWLRASYLGSTMRKLLVTATTTACRRAPCRSATSTRIPTRTLACRSRSTARSWTSPQNTGEGRFDALQLELQRRFKGGLALNAAYTLADSDSNAPDSGNSTIGVVQYDPYDIEKDRGPDPNVVKHRFVVNGTWDIPVGRDRPLAPPCRPGPTRSSAAGRCRRSCRRDPGRT